MERIPPDEQELWMQQLDAPLPGQAKAAPTPDQIEDDGALFMAFMQGGQGRG